MAGPSKIGANAGEGPVPRGGGGPAAHTMIFPWTRTPPAVTSVHPRYAPLPFGIMQSDQRTHCPARPRPTPHPDRTLLGACSSLSAPHRSLAPRYTRTRCNRHGTCRRRTSCSRSERRTGRTTRSGCRSRQWAEGARRSHRGHTARRPGRNICPRTSDTSP
jgi:hypothetical protein